MAEGPDGTLQYVLPAVGRRASLDSVWLTLDQLQGRSPWPFNELGERLRVTACALLRLTVPEFGCAPFTRDLDSVAAAELQAVRHEFGGSRRLAAAALETAPGRFAGLDTVLDHLVMDTIRVFAMGWPSATRQPQAVPARLPPGFWEASWPLYLVPHNERLVAHRARLLLADMAERLGYGDGREPLFGAYGDRSTLVRVGVPRAIARPPGPEVGRVSLITYTTPGTHETLVRPGNRLEGVPLDFALAARSGVHPVRASGFAAEDYDTLAALDHQQVRYLREGRSHVELYTRWTRPAGCPSARPVLGFFLLDARLQRVSRPIELDPAQPPALKRFHLELAPGAYVYSLELLDRGCRRAERARYVLTVPPVEEQRASDLMLVDEAHFGGDRWVGRVGERPPVTVRPSLTLVSGDVARFYWELYGVAADATEAGRLTVTFEVVNVREERVPMRELGRAAAEARRRAGTLDIRYDLTVPPGDGPLALGLTVGIPEGTRGVHVARARVTDARTKRTVRVERAFFVAP
jgi:hypothetical protein